MVCQACGANNRDGAAFCRNCGRLLAGSCPRCAAPVVADANFCDTCGAPLSPQAWAASAGQPPLPAISAPAASAAAIAGGQPPDTADRHLERYIPRELLSKLREAQRSGAMTGERRVVTMLFCDIKGSTSMAGVMDPEEWSEIINGAFEQMVRPIYKYEGTVARLMGDGLLAFFGAPIAHEDDARRAVLAALEIAAGVANYRQAVGLGLDVRVGINTGLVVVGAVGSDLRLEYSALGDAINLAARMEQTAAPGTIQITGDTLRLIAGQFDIEALGPIDVKGKEDPVHAFRVLRRRTAAERSRDASGGQTPLVDRTLEWEMFRRAFDNLGQGLGGALFLVGEAGLGKSRLIHEALERLAPGVVMPGRIYEATAFSYETGQPYGLIVRLLRQFLEVSAADPPEFVRERLTAVMADLDEDAYRPMLEAVLGLAEGAALVSTDGFSGELIAGLREIGGRLSAEGPFVLVVDDLQWADASSIEVLDGLLSLVEDATLLLLCGMRKERRSAAWKLKEAAEAGYPHRYLEADLQPLADEDSRLLLSHLLREGALGADLEALILDKAEGNPLFIEEVVRHLFERGHLHQAGGVWTAAVALENIDLPDSLQGLLTARIDRLDEESRRLLQQASVIGRAFSRSVLATLSDQPSTLDRSLLELQRLDLVHEVARLPEPEYAFRHTLTHAATYATILLRQRRTVHRRVAEVLSERAGGRESAAPAIAHHFLESDDPALALPHLLVAGDGALRLGAMAEALVHYNRALPLALKGGLPSEGLIRLYNQRGRALEHHSRFREAMESYEELERLGQEREDKAMQLQAVLAQGTLRGMVTAFHDPAAAQALMERALALAQQSGDRATEARIQWNLLNAFRFTPTMVERGAVAGRRALALARELELNDQLPYVLNDLADVLGMVGSLDEAKAMLAEARGLWTAEDHRDMRADTLTNAALWTAISGDLPPALDLADEACALALQSGNWWAIGYSSSARAHILIYQGRYAEALPAIDRGWEASNKAGLIGAAAMASSRGTIIYLALGRPDKAVALARAGVELTEGRIAVFSSICRGRLSLALLAAGDPDGAAAVLAGQHMSEHSLKLDHETVLAAAFIDFARGDAGPLEAAARRAVERARSHGTQAHVPGFALAHAQALRALGREAEARDELDAAAWLARRLGIRSILWQILGERAELEAHGGDAAVAVACLFEARQEIDWIAAPLPDDLRASFLARPEVLRITRAGEA